MHLAITGVCEAARMHRVLRFSSLASVLVLGACSFSASVGDTPTSVAEDLIEGELADDLGLAEVTAECAEPPDEDVGATFACTSDSDLGLVRWEATIAEDDTVSVESLNLLSENDVALLEESAVAELEASVGQPLGAESFDCGSEPVVLDDADEFVCALTDPVNGDVYDTTITILDTDSGRFEFEVADSPR